MSSRRCSFKSRKPPESLDDKSAVSFADAMHFSHLNFLGFGGGLIAVFCEIILAPKTTKALVKRPRKCLLYNLLGFSRHWMKWGLSGRHVEARLSPLHFTSTCVEPGKCKLVKNIFKKEHISAIERVFYIGNYLPESVMVFFWNFCFASQVWKWRLEKC